MNRARYIHSPVLEDLLSCSNTQKKAHAPKTDKHNHSTTLINSSLDYYHYLQHNTQLKQEGVGERLNRDLS